MIACTDQRQTEKRALLPEIEALLFPKPIHAKEERNGPASVKQELSTAKPRSNHTFLAYSCEGHWQKWQHKLKVMWCIKVSIAIKWSTERFSLSNREPSFCLCRSQFRSHLFKYRYLTAHQSAQAHFIVEPHATQSPRCNTVASFPGSPPAQRRWTVRRGRAWYPFACDATETSRIYQ